jgi:hypothetical protein
VSKHEPEKHTPFKTDCGSHFGSQAMINDLVRIAIKL